MNRLDFFGMTAGLVAVAVCAASNCCAGERTALINGRDLAGGTAVVDQNVTSGRPSHRPIRVACIGDSITWGYAMTNRVVECYPAQLQRLLGSGYEVRNFGDSGSCAYSTPEKAQSGWCPHPWRTGKQGPAAYAYNPDIVVCNLGANDLACYMKEFTPRGDGKMERDRGLFVREYADLLRAFARDGRMPRVIIWTRLAPFGKVHRLKGKPDPFVMRHDLERVAVEVGAEILDMYAPLLPYAETPHYAPDGCHPEGGAQRVIAEITARKILRKGGREGNENRIHQ